MKRILLVTVSFLIVHQILAQTVDPLLMEVKMQLEEVKEANAYAELILDVDFIKMPIKYAQIQYNKGKPISYTSENFIMIPKKGLDFSWSELFEHDIMTVDRGTEKKDNKTFKVLNVIPLDKKADFAIMTLKIDTASLHIREAEITTKNEGSYSLILDYSNRSRFPKNIMVEFELERIKIPLSFMGNDTEIDKQILKSDELKKGRMTLILDWKAIILEE
jgi:hypothetical protein